MQKLLFLVFIDYSSVIMLGLMSCNRYGGTFSSAIIKCNLKSAK